MELNQFHIYARNKHVIGFLSIFGFMQAFLKLLTIFYSGSAIRNRLKVLRSQFLWIKPIDRTDWKWERERERANEREKRREYNAKNGSDIRREWRKKNIGWLWRRELMLFIWFEMKNHLKCVHCALCVVCSMFGVSMKPTFKNHIHIHWWFNQTQVDLLCQFFSSQLVTAHKFSAFAITFIVNCN